MAAHSYIEGKEKGTGLPFDRLSYAESIFLSDMFMLLKSYGEQNAE